MATEQQVLESLRSVQDPDLHRDIVSLGFIQNLKLQGGEVSFTLMYGFAPGNKPMLERIIRPVG